MFSAKHAPARAAIIVLIAAVLVSAAGTDCSRAGEGDTRSGQSVQTEIKEINAMNEENNIGDPLGNDAEFNASVEVGKDKLRLHFELKNKTKEDIYLLDIFPTYDLETMKREVNLNTTVTVWSEPDGVGLIRGLPPYPQEKDMAAYYTPYASKIGPGEMLKRKIELAVPLVEFSPYYSPLDVDKYEPVDVTKIRLYVDFIKSSAEGFEAKEVDFAKDVYFVKSKFLIRDTQRVRREFTSGAIRLRKYPETFTRAL